MTASSRYTSLLRIGHFRVDYFEPHCESEAKCKVFVMKISSFIHMQTKLKSFALLSLVFMARFTTTRKGPTHFVLPFKLHELVPENKKI